MITSKELNDIDIMTRKRLAEKVAEGLKEKKLTASRCALLAEVSSPTVCRMLKCRVVRLDSCAKVLHVLEKGMYII
jgi:hypothetical protein